MNGFARMWRANGDALLGDCPGFLTRDDGAALVWNDIVILRQRAIKPPPSTYTTDMRHKYNNNNNNNDDVSQPSDA